MKTSSLSSQCRHLGTLLAATALSFAGLATGLHPAQAQQALPPMANPAVAVAVSQWRELNRTQLAALVPGADTAFTVANWHGWDQVRLRWISRTEQLTDAEFVLGTPVSEAQARALAVQQLGLLSESIQSAAATQTGAVAQPQAVAAAKERGYAVELVPASTGSANPDQFSGLWVIFLHPASAPTH